MRWEEPHHPGPGLQLERHNNPHSPTLQHLLPLQPPLHPPLPINLPPMPDPPSIDDANALRGAHFRRLLGRRLVQALIAGGAIAAGIAAGILLGAAAGSGSLLVALGAALAVVFLLADKRAADDFFADYAERRGMTLMRERGRLPRATPLLRKGDDRYTERSLLGPLGDGVEGTLALYTYEEETRDSDGNRQTSYSRYTVGLVEVPECGGFVPELYCRRKSGPRALQGLEDAFRRSTRRLTLESEALQRRYEIFAGKDGDEIWLRRLFSPTFIVWLADSAPDKFAFELVDGTLCCFVDGHRESAAELDALAAATSEVARRLHEESHQTVLPS